MATVKFGVTYYNDKPEYGDLKQYAQIVDSVDLDSLWITENITSDSPSLEVFTALSFLAANTERATIGPSVMLLPLRNPILVAQTVTSLDILSGGRAVLGVGVGGSALRGSSERDFIAYGGSVKERGGRADEALEVIHRLWTEESVTFKGKYFDIQDYTLLPKPTQKPHPPIVIGGHAEGVLRRAGRWGDGLMPVRRTVEEAKDLFDRVEEYGRQHGRKPEQFTRYFMFHTCLGDTPEKAAETASRVLTDRYRAKNVITPKDPYLLGPVDHCREVIQQFIEGAGIRHFIFHFCCDPKDVNSQVKKIGEEIIPKLRLT